MYVGHAAIALALTAWRPRTPMALVALAAYGPDWVETAASMAGAGPVAAESWSHCLVGVVAGAALAALLAGMRRREDAWTIAAAWLSHWPADVLTAWKPLLDPTHLVGFDLYRLPGVDFALEGVLVVAAALLYARAFAPTRRRLAWVAVTALLLVMLQGLLDAGLAGSGPVPWRPRLAIAQWRPQLTIVLGTDVSSGRRMPLALSPGNFTASEQWHRTASRASSPWSA